MIDPSKSDLQPISVAIVEDDASVRQKLTAIIEQSDDLCCIGCYANAENALIGIAAQAPRVVLVDINLPGMSGVECVRHLSVQSPEILVMILTVHEDTDTIFDALSAGASGYLLKPVRKSELVQAVRDLVAGGSPMTSSIARKVVHSFQQKPTTAAIDHDVLSLSEREVAVLQMLAEGLIYKEIADKLGISLWTVSTYVQRAYKKLHVTGRADALAKIRRQQGL